MSRISVKDAVKRYGNNTVIPDLNLEIGDGELFTLLGPSGCGKTTLLRMIAGFNSIEGGDIFFNEKRINDMDPSKRNIGMVFQNYAIFPDLSVRDNVAFGLKNRKVDKAEIKKRTDEFLNLMQIMQYADRMPNQLSGGQQQRIALARALVISPDVLLMDEPLSNLDAKLRVEMRSVIRHTQKSVGITTVYVTHDQEEAMAISDRIAVMKDGVIQHVGTPRDIYQRPKNVFVATFIGRTNIVNAHVKDGIITFADGYHEHIDALDKAAEQDVRCSIRPEEFIICKDGTDGIHGTVQECTYLGLNTHYTIDTDQGDSVEIVEESSIGEGLKKGEKVLLKVKKEKINVFTLGTIALYALFLLYPMAYLIRQSVLDPDTGGFTLAYFTKFFSKSYYFDTLINSFKVSITATVLSIAIGTPLAYLFTIFKIKGKSVLNILIVVASMSAPFIGAYSWILLLGRSGVITAFFKNLGIAIPDIYGFGGIVLVMTLQLFPLVFLYAKGALKNIDNSLIEAAENLGCSGIACFFKVVVPLIMPTLLAAALLVFMRSFADFGTPMLIGEGYRTFPVVLYTEFINEVGGSDGFAAAIAVIAIVVTTLVFLVQKYVSNKNAFALNSMHPVEEREARKGINALVHLVVYLVVGIAIMPQAYVIYTSFKNTQGKIFVDGYSLQSYQTAIGKLGRSIQNTIIIPLLALVVIVLLAVLIAYLVVRRRNALTNVVDVLSMIPYIVPGTVLGIALLIGFNKPPLLISGTMLIMVVALIIRRLPYTIRSSVAILQQIPMSIEEAAISLGASKMKAFFRITVPMMASGIISGAILSWVTMISELSTAIILYTGKTKTLTVAIYTEVIRGNYGTAAALSTIMTILTVISLLAFSKLNGGKDISL